MKIRHNIIWQLMVMFALLLGACADTEPALKPLSEDAVILAFGDSITYGTGARKEQSYPSQLESLSGRKVINAGVPGEVSEEGLMRLPRLLEIHQPDLLILCHGGNDILRRGDLAYLQNNLARMVTQAKDRSIPVVLLGVPEFGLLLSSAELYSELARQLDVIYIQDLLPGILKDRHLKSDPIHPNQAGYQRMAETIYQVLKDRGAL